MKRTRAAILAAAGAVLGVLTLRVLRNRGSETDGELAESIDGETDASADSDAELSAGPRSERTDATERTPRIRPDAPGQNRSGDDTERTPRIRGDGRDRSAVREEVAQTPRIRSGSRRLRKAGKGWIRR